MSRSVRDVCELLLELALIIVIVALVWMADHPRPDHAAEAHDQVRCEVCSHPNGMR